MRTFLSAIIARLMAAPTSPHWGYPRDRPRR